MHSFKSAHNRINWTLLVEGDIAGWPDFRPGVSRHHLSERGERQGMKEEPSVNIRLDGNGRSLSPRRNALRRVRLRRSARRSGEEHSKFRSSGSPKAKAMKTWPFTSSGGPTWKKTAADLLRNRNAFRRPCPTARFRYDGRIVKIRWCVRVRAFLQGGKEVFGQKLFRLGDVPAIPPPPDVGRGRMNGDHCFPRRKSVLHPADQAGRAAVSVSAGRQRWKRFLNGCEDTAGWGEIVGPHGSGKSTLLAGLDSRASSGRLANATHRTARRRAPPAGEFAENSRNRHPLHAPR